MSSKLGTARRRGQRRSYSAELLAVTVGVSGLRHLTDAEVEYLVDIAKIAVDQVYADGFKAGWDAALNYNADCDARLLASGPTQNH